MTCPSCFQTFGISAPSVDELPADLDYDCEVCCRPMMILVSEAQGEVWAEARGLGD